MNFSPKTYLNDYLYENPPTPPRKRKKISVDDFTIPGFSEWSNIISINYNVSQLKDMAKYYSQKRSGNKKELVKRIYNHLKFSFYAVKIQKAWRGFMIRHYNALHGPGIFKREKCVNQSDFLSLNDLKDISHNQFFSFEDEGFIYGFDAKSLHNLIIKNETPTNPYNRKVLDENVLDKFNKFLRYGKLLKKNTIVSIANTTNSLSITKRIELNAHTIFQKIDTFGHITDASWFITLDKPYLIKLIRELADIWNYRASLTPMIKTAICPPHGNPFSGIEMDSLTIQSEQRLKMNILNIFDNLLSKSPERNNQALGAFYILGSLTLVSQSAANALPWLYESVLYLPSNQNA